MSRIRDLAKILTASTDISTDAEVTSSIASHAAAADPHTGYLKESDFNAAGKNYLINGGFDIWQRGTSFTNPATSGSVFSADRWCHYFNGNATVTRETSIKPDTSIYSMKITATASSASNDTYQLIEEQQMEQFRGKAVTYSVKLAGTPTLSPSLSLSYSTTSNDNLFNTATSISAAVIANPTINTSTFVTWVYSFTVPVNAKTLRLGIISNAMANTNVFYIAEAQLELGLAATSFSRAGGTIQGELAACQRYYWRRSATGKSTLGTGVGEDSTRAWIAFSFPTEMRIVPTTVEWSGLTVSDGVSYTENVTSINAATLSANRSSGRITFTTAGNVVQNRVAIGETAPGGGYFALGAEL